MSPINLIPPQRRRAKARAARLRAWCIINVIAAVVFVSVGIGISLASAAVGAPARDVQKLSRQIEEAHKQLMGVRGASAKYNQVLASASAVADQPDWSLLLAIVAHAVGEEVMLNQCTLAVQKDEGSAGAGAVTAVVLDTKTAPPAGRQRIMLHIAGIGRTQGAVAQFMLRLEGTKLFDQVRLLQTTHQSGRGVDVIAFDIDCPLRGHLGVEQ